MASRNRERRAAGNFPRTARLNQLIREVLADQLERVADSDERLRLATVTGVEITSDLQNATVFMSSFESQLEESLAEHRIQLQAEIGRQLRIKRTPKLQFVGDPATVEGAKVEEILRRLKGRGDGPAASGD
jgi:ribosome-binding factor A